MVCRRDGRRWAFPSARAVVYPDQPQWGKLANCWQTRPTFYVVIVTELRRWTQPPSAGPKTVICYWRLCLPASIVLIIEYDIAKVSACIGQKLLNSNLSLPVLRHYPSSMGACQSCLGRRDRDDYEEVWCPPRLRKSPVALS